jgi:DNA-binding MarR family transcriptional regulator
MPDSDNESTVTLGLLNAVEGNSAITQRGAAKELGIALGLTNSYLKRCVKKGLIKIQQAPANRYTYYLTPSGLVEKARLTAEFLSQGFQFFRLARTQCEDIFNLCEKQGWQRVGLHGLTDLAEIAVLCAANFDIEIIGIIDDGSALESYTEKPVVRELADLGEFEVILITDLGNPQASYDKICQIIPENKVLAPDILNISRTDGAPGDGK